MKRELTPEQWKAIRDAGRKAGQGQGDGKMTSLEELKHKLNSSIWSNRRDAVRVLGEMKTQRDQVVPLLKERLANDDDDDVTEESVKALERLQALDDVVFETLKGRLNDQSSSVRKKIVEALLKFATRKSSIAPLLKQRLVEDDSWEVIEKIVGALEQWQDLDTEVFEELKQRANDESSSIRNVVVRLLPKFLHRQHEEVVSLLKQRLETDDVPNVIECVIEVSHQIGMTVEQMRRSLACNPHFLMDWLPHHWHELWHRGGIVDEVVEHALRRRWWRLPRDFRRHMSWPWFGDEPWHHCPECHMMWRELIRPLERHGGARQEVEWLLAALGRWWGNPRSRFGCYDFEELMSLRVEQSVTYEEVNTLRFRFLDAFVTDQQGRLLGEWARGWLQEFQQDWDELLRTEEQFDRNRDEISDLRRQQEEIIREAEWRTEGEWRWEQGEPPRLPEDLQARWNEIAERLRRLEGDEEPGELQRHQKPLEDATERLLPQLRERGVRFKLIEVEGVLGEYNFFERKVTLYPPMIQLAAWDLAQDGLGLPPPVLEDRLSTVTEIHETAHAILHLGRDSDAREWRDVGSASSELHELLAQYYAISLIQRLKDKELEQVFLSLNEKQSERYRLWTHVKDTSLEAMRQFFLAKSRGVFEGDIVHLAKEVVEVIGGALGLLQRRVPPFDEFARGFDSLHRELTVASDTLQLTTTSKALIRHCESFPFVKELLSMSLPGGLPSEEERRFWLVNTLCEGKGVKGPSLRLDFEEFQKVQPFSFTAAQLDTRNEMIRGLERIRKLFEEQPEAEIKDNRLESPKDKRDTTLYRRRGFRPF